eukprot:CAMPEP_0118897912 /NCGR_PEP_ID=MMETSP1166-20130328/5120_1 /TAXON_ID=1104430 /ORGANISM="Chrysoreinhardia sp, Strain CCMP3193" /LENGTH=278 /DNA_ID=CAMNT_0006836991 /DNA_START=300 /DNA_END=1137 /DNA_ORIENTATION=-
MQNRHKEQQEHKKRGTSPPFPPSFEENEERPTDRRTSLVGKSVSQSVSQSTKREEEEVEQGPSFFSVSYRFSLRGGLLDDGEERIVAVSVVASPRGVVCWASAFVAGSPRDHLEVVALRDEVLLCVFFEESVVVGSGDGEGVEAEEPEGEDDDEAEEGHDGDHDGDGREADGREAEVKAPPSAVHPGGGVRRRRGEADDAGGGRDEAHDEVEPQADAGPRRVGEEEVRPKGHGPRVEVFAVDLEVVHRPLEGPVPVAAAAAHEEPQDHARQHHLGQPA